MCHYSVINSRLVCLLIIVSSCLGQGCHEEETSNNENCPGGLLTDFKENAVVVADTPLRNGPSEDSTAVYYLDKNTTVKVIKIVDDKWAQVDVKWSSDTILYLSTCHLKPQTLEGQALYRGRLEIETFRNRRILEHAWTLDNIVFYTWVNITNEQATRWLKWYWQCNKIYERVLNRDASLHEDPTFGPSKVLIVVSVDPMLCTEEKVESTGCVKGGKIQSSRKLGEEMAVNPDSVIPHWELLSSMALGESTEKLDKRAIWPLDGWHYGVSRTLAGICFHAIQGDKALKSADAAPGQFLDSLEKWEKENLKFAEVFKDGKSTHGEYTAHHLIAAMLYRIYQKTDVETIAAIFRLFETCPEREYPKEAQDNLKEAQEALCDFVDSINKVTANEWNDTLRGPWGMPDGCSN